MRSPNFPLARFKPIKNIRNVNQFTFTFLNCFEWFSVLLDLQSFCECTSTKAFVVLNFPVFVSSCTLYNRCYEFHKETWNFKQ
ncbi:hypothetical protein RCL_jg10730.t3 [Rhizophagus clarus]|uniref:Uncharacterized protein n=1 Tax=Rhizophagus clarus TaxID=94130 RepID=A0A8H3QK22_9GLOM|nr:hypothetical protein RCL_jg10730.t3 [Rhizophagus clarus]